MLRFKNYLSEEVTPAAQVKDGSIDLEKPAVRGQINASLASVTAQPAVTPYIVLHKISKALAYFHIIMPKRAYLEGDKGIEVVELKQFGHRMGMTNDGQFVNDVPGRYFLFLSYRLSPSVGGGYGFAGDQLQSLGGSFKVTAKVVDEVELQSLLASAEISLAEDCDAYENQQKYKAMAPKEKMHTALGDCDCGPGDSESTKSAVDTSMRRKDKKLSAAELEEGRMPASVIRHKQKLANMTPEEKEKKFAGKSKEELESMARRHGYGKDSDVYSKHIKEEERPNAWGQYPKEAKETRKRLRQEKKAKAFLKAQKKVNEEQIDEMAHKALTAAGYKAGPKDSTTGFGQTYTKGKKSVYVDADGFAHHGSGSKATVTHGNKETAAYLNRAAGKLAKEETQIDEVVSKGKAISAYRRKEGEGRDTSKLHDLIMRKFGAATAKHAERAGAQDTVGLVRRGEDRGKEDSIARDQRLGSAARITKGRKVHRQDTSTLKGNIKRRLGSHTQPKHLPEETLDEAKKKKVLVKKKNFLVTLINDPRAKRGGGVMSIPRDQYDPKKHNLASEETIAEKWSKKYKDSINCSNPKGFSQKAHCDGKKKNLDEKLNKAMSAGEVISHFIHSKDPQFEGKSKKKRQKMALGAYYGMHPEKSKLDEMMSRMKKTTAHRKMATGVDTQTRHALDSDRKTETIAVKRIGKPGSEPVRIRKDKFDPSKHIKA